jgi:hypothetical protein
MAGFVGIALRGFGKALRKGFNKASNMSDKTAGTVGMTGMAGAVVGAGALSKIKNKKESTKLNTNGSEPKKSKP